MKQYLTYLLFLCALPAWAQDICLTPLEKQVLEGVNAHRKTKGLPALALSRTLLITANKNLENVVNKSNLVLRPDKFGGYKAENEFIRGAISGTTPSDIVRYLTAPSSYNNNAKIIENAGEFARFSWKTIGICIRTTNSPYTPTSVCVFVGEKAETTFNAPECKTEAFFNVAQVSHKPTLQHPILKFKTTDRVSIYSVYIDEAGKRKKIEDDYNGFKVVEANEVATVYLKPEPKAVSFEVYVSTFIPTIVTQKDIVFKIMPDQKDTLWRTLHLKGNTLADVKEFLAQGGNINEQDDRGYTMLLKATWRDKADIVAYLLEKGADVNILSKEREAPLTFTTSEKIYDLLMTKNPKLDLPLNPVSRYTLLHSFAINGLLKGVKYLVEVKKVNIEAQNSQNATPLFHAVMDNQVEVARYLLQKGAKQTSGWGSYPIHEAVSKRSVSMVTLLLEKGGKAHLNLLNTAGLAPLHYAVMEADLEIVKILVENGANVSIKSQEGQTPLDLCFEENTHEKIKNYLISKGAR
jgi:ankyrin repeat protein